MYKDTKTEDFNFQDFLDRYQKTCFESGKMHLNYSVNSFQSAGDDLAKCMLLSSLLEQMGKEGLDSLTIERSGRKIEVSISEIETPQEVYREFHLHHKSHYYSH